MSPRIDVLHAIETADRIHSCRRFFIFLSDEFKVIPPAMRGLPEFYEESIWVPLIVRVPGKARVAGDMVSHADLFFNLERDRHKEVNLIHDPAFQGGDPQAGGGSGRGLDRGEKLD